MPPSVASLTASESGTDQANYTTASISPTNGLVWLLWTQATHLTIDTPVPDPTAVGNGLTWTRKSVVTYNVSAGIRRTKIALFVGTGTPSPGTVVISWTDTMTICSWDIWEITDAGATDPIVQVTTNTGSTGSLSLTVTQAAAASSNNRPAAAFGHANTDAPSPRANWTEISDQSALRSFQTQFRTDAFETVASTIWSPTGAEVGGIAAEIMEGAPGAIQQMIPYGMLGTRRV